MRTIRTKKTEVKVTKKSQPAEPKKATRLTRQLSIKPRASEKAYALSESHNTYIFDVDHGVNKFDLAQAVGAQYEVTVTGVRLANAQGKAVRTYRQKGRRSVSGKRSDVRKAYVTLKDGDKLPIFAAVEETKAPEPSAGSGKGRSR